MKRKSIPEAPEQAFSLSGELRMEFLEGGRKRLTVQNVRHILCFSQEQMQFRAGKEGVTLSGREMICTCYAGRTLQIVGFFYGMSFDGKAEKKGGER